ncbi:glycosyltransferase family 39 protein [Nonomuraea typhae]|uniref:glycosyltransferase family 39 protein n=1 Tax=Nonomuraea typhae TaxID=2603600 RepID=UPI0012F8F13C|nr:glycosyltransferase family 39 protein [Nonomuraea typhae]
MDRTFAWRPVTVIALATAVILMTLSGAYDYHRDELYFRMLAERPAWGYVDQPPLTPMLARVAIGVFGDTLTAIRIPAALSVAVLLVVVALIVRELGGGRFAQVLSALGVATGGFVMIVGHSLLTLSVDLPLWTAAILFVLKALLRDEPRWWLAVGAVIGVATYNKHLIVILVIGLAAGLLAVGPRRVLRSPWLWAGALLAVLLALPNLLYQVANGWPQLKMAAALSADKGAEMRALFLPMQVLLLGPAATVIAAFGFARLWRDRRVRALAVAYPVAGLLTVLSGGRPDYIIGLLVLFFAAGCVSLEAWRPRWRVVGVAALAVVAAGNTLIALPIVPQPEVAQTVIPEANQVVRESLGWPSFAEQVRAVVRTLPPDEQARVILLMGNYGNAGAAVRAGLPRVFSPHNQLFEYGPPPESGTVAITVDVIRRAMREQFTSCQEAGEIDNGLGLDNEIQGNAIFVCRGLKIPWRVGWVNFRHYS